MTFNDLHHQSYPLLICNVWDAMSTRLAEKLGFQAIGTSSAAISSMLGYEDGENIRFSELCYMVKRIVASTNLPLTVDIESGYCRKPYEIAKNIEDLASLGVVGINIEDSVVSQERKLIDSDLFAETLPKITMLLKDSNVNIFVNVRIDIFLIGHHNPVEEVQERVRLYKQAGADGVFIPCIEKESDIQKVTEHSALPVNVMCMPNLSDSQKLQARGVQRISMGDFLFKNMYSHLEHTLMSVLHDRSLRSVF